MIELYDDDKNARLGQITEAQRDFLVDHLQETHPEDQDYYIDAATLEMLEADGADPELIGMLRSALGNREGFEVRWEETG